MAAAVATTPGCPQGGRIELVAGPTGLFGVFENGREHTVYHFLDIAAGFVKSARLLIPGSSWTLVDLMTGQRIAADEAEWQAILTEQYEAMEAAEGWGQERSDPPAERAPGGPDLVHPRIEVMIDSTLPQSAFDWSALVEEVRFSGRVQLGDVTSAAVLLDLAQELRPLGLTLRPIGRQMVEVRAA